MKVGVRLIAGTALAASSAGLILVSGGPANSQASPTTIGLTTQICVAQTHDVAGCQPGAFDAMMLNIPTRRINEAGMLDPTATELEVRWGARLLQERLGLFRNFDDLHWVPMTPSVFDEATGTWGGGDLDGLGDGRALTISGKCLFAGHANSGGGEQPMRIYRIADDPVRDAPVLVGEIPVPMPGADDSIMAAHMLTKADGTDVIIVARDISTDEGGLNVYEVDPETCGVLASSDYFEWGGDMHEFGIWADPNNPLRLLIVGSAWSGSGNPDPYRPGEVNPDIRVQAITDENTGDMLQLPISVAHFTLGDVGGPLANERPDETGLFRDGRFADYRGTGVTLPNGNDIAYPTSQSNRAHQTVFSTDGKRVYVAHGTAGFYILNSEAIAANTNADLAAGTAGCNFSSTNVWTDGVQGGEIDGTRYAEVVNDCLHMVVNDDVGVQAMLAAGDVRGYERLLDRSRYDPTPSEYNSTGIHSAIFVPNRPSNDVSNTDGARPAYIILTSERFSCPTSHMWMLNIEVEAFPFVTDIFGVANNELLNCAAAPAFEYDGTPRRNLSLQNHNPTVFENLVFVSWYGHGVRAIDISNPYNIREVGHAVPAPHGMARSYPVFSEGLMYWVDNDTGLHVARYTGPWAEQIPTDLVWEGNAAAGHR
ncbi:MAG: hypothetical protein KIT43_14535 [Bauldia sp.]|nr:hypothetical protein [Bauldia sp.]MCW5716742.1 hypothetical protein [Bauldia sp.]